MPNYRNIAKWQHANIGILLRTHLPVMVHRDFGI